MNNSFFYIEDQKKNIYKYLLSFSIPILITNIFQKIYALADTTIIAHVFGDYGTNVIGIGSSITDFTETFLLGFASGCGIVIANYFGKKDYIKLKKGIQKSIIIGLIVSAIIAVIFCAFSDRFLKIIDANSSMWRDIKRYMLIVIGFSPVSFGFYFLISMIRAVGKSAISSYYIIGSSIINIILDYIFVFCFHWQYEGVAIGTVISKVVPILIYSFYFFNKNRCKDGEISKKKIRIPETVSLVRTLLYNGIAVATTFSIVSISSVIMQKYVNELGTSYITIYVLAKKITAFLLAPMMAITFSNSIFAAQKVGEEDFINLKLGEKSTNFMVFICCLLSAIIWLLFGNYITRLVAGELIDELIIRKVFEFILINICFYIFLGLLSNYRYLIQSSGYAAVATVVSGMELLMKLCFCMWGIRAIGFKLIVIIEPVCWIILAVLSLVVYKGKIYKSMVFK